MIWRFLSILIKRTQYNVSCAAVGARGKSCSHQGRPGARLDASKAFLQRRPTAIISRICHLEVLPHPQIRPPTGGQVFKTWPIGDILDQILTRAFSPEVCNLKPLSSTRLLLLLTPKEVRWMKKTHPSAVWGAEVSLWVLSGPAWTFPLWPVFRRREWLGKQAFTFLSDVSLKGLSTEVSFTPSFRLFG